MILVIPSIDISGGRSLCLIEGVAGRSGIYSDDPVELAKLWRRENAKALHVGDIDGVRDGVPRNFDVVKQIVDSVDIPVEYGGGLRTAELAARALDAGVYRVTIGTMVIEDPSATADLIARYGPRRIALAIGVQGDIVFIKGGKESTPRTAVELAGEMKALGFERVIYTDLARKEGTGSPDLDGITRFARETHMQITLSGGVSSLDDLLRVQALEPHGIDSVVIGKPLYENRFACELLWRAAEAGTLPPLDL
jgi:phosphoribosylformimino-5-aminoimidazole carboxamide ribotide isomerase